MEIIYEINMYVVFIALALISTLIASAVICTLPLHNRHITEINFVTDENNKMHVMPTFKNYKILYIIGCVWLIFVACIMILLSLNINNRDVDIKVIDEQRLKIMSIDKKTESDTLQFNLKDGSYLTYSDYLVEFKNYKIDKFNYLENDEIYTNEIVILDTVSREYMQIGCIRLYLDTPATIVNIYADNTEL